MDTGHEDIIGHTEGLYVEREELLVLDEVCDLEAVGCLSTLGFATLRTRDNKRRHSTRGNTKVGCTEVFEEVRWWTLGFSVEWRCFYTFTGWTGLGVRHSLVQHSKTPSTFWER